MEITLNLTLQGVRTKNPEIQTKNPEIQTLTRQFPVESIRQAEEIMMAVARGLAVTRFFQWKIEIFQGDLIVLCQDQTTFSKPMDKN